jgi:hypothetical protein
LPLPSASGYVSISDTPTGDFHPIRSCPCRAYTLAAPDALKRAGEHDYWASECIAAFAVRRVDNGGFHG